LLVLYAKKTKKNIIKNASTNTSTCFNNKITSQIYVSFKQIKTLKTNPANLKTQEAYKLKTY